MAGAGIHRRISGEEASGAVKGNNFKDGQRSTCGPIDHNKDMRFILPEFLLCSFCVFLFVLYVLYR